MGEWMGAVALGLMRRPESDEDGGKCWETPAGNLFSVPAESHLMARRNNNVLELWARMPGQMTPDV